MSFTNKVVIVTGASAGIGANTAILFSKAGANVVLVGRNETRLYNVAQQCTGNPLTITADVTNNDDVKRIIAETIVAFGRLDILVNNAGILRYQSIFDENLLEIYDELIDTNLRAVVNLTRYATPHLIESKGNIVNISSVASKTILNSKLIAYSASKAALDVFTKGTAFELSQYGVRVNTVSPGPVRTGILKTCGDETPWESLSEAMLLGKISEPDEIGELVMYLASDKAASITGVDYVVDNGMMFKK